MTVRELIAALSQLDPDLPVFMYSSFNEGDAPVQIVRVETEPYCYSQGDSCIEEYITKNHAPVCMICDEAELYFEEEED